MTDALTRLRKKVERKRREMADRAFNRDTENGLEASGACEALGHVLALIAAVAQEGETTKNPTLPVDSLREIAERWALPTVAFVGEQWLGFLIDQFEAALRDEQRSQPSLHRLGVPVVFNQESEQPVMRLSSVSPSDDYSDAQMAAGYRGQAEALDKAREARLRGLIAMWRERARLNAMPPSDASSDIRDPARWAWKNIGITQTQCADELEQELAR